MSENYENIMRYKNLIAGLEYVLDRVTSIKARNIVKMIIQELEDRAND